MAENNFERSVVSDDFRTKEYEKFELSKKFFKTAETIGFASTYPTIENISKAYGMVVDYIVSIPISQHEKVLTRRNKLLDDLDEVNLILHGNKANKDVLKAMDKLHIGFVSRRDGMRFVDILTELPNIAKRLRTILVEAGDNAVGWGLRIPLSEIKSKGMDKMNKEEGFTVEDNGFADDYDDEAAELKGKGD